MDKVLGTRFNQLGAKARAALPDMTPKRRKLAPPGTKLIKKTHSVCPECGVIVTADVAERDGAAWMFKRCAAHGDSAGLIDPDVGFYRRVMNKAPVPQRPYNTLLIPITHRCNLNCALCFVPKRDRDDLSIEQIKAIIDAFPGHWIGLSGGEPTLREDLPELIRYIRAVGKECQLLSNAIKLADRDYTRRLIDAGLGDILFSFNGFSDRFFEEINREPLLDVKLEALRNCIEEGMQVAISPTIFRDLNEGDLIPLVQLCLENAPSIYELRIRGACRVGRHGKMAPLRTSELLTAVAGALGVELADLLDHFDPAGCHHAAIQFNMLGAFKEWKTEYELVDWCPGAFALDKSIDEQTCEFVAKVRAESGTRLPDEAVLARYKFLAINVWGWPDAGNLDYQEICSHGVYHLYDNARPMNFCEAMLVAEQL